MIARLIIIGWTIFIGYAFVSGLMEASKTAAGNEAALGFAAMVSMVLHLVAWAFVALPTYMISRMVTRRKEDVLTQRLRYAEEQHATPPIHRRRPGHHATSQEEPPPRRVRPVFLVALGATVLVGIWLAWLNKSEIATPARVASPTPSAVSVPPLQLLSVTCAVEHGYGYVRGEVKNVSNSAIKGLMVVGEFRQADGTLIKTADSVVDYDPLMPGQSSPFEALTPHNPLATKCQIGFKTFWGPEIPHTKPDDAP
jgi:hypothetical protein